MSFGSAGTSTTHTAIVNALNGCINERCCSPVGIKINDIHAITLCTMVVHQRARPDEHLANTRFYSSTHHASPSFTLTFAGLMTFSEEPSGSASSFSCKSLSSIFRRMASTAAEDKSFAITYLCHDA